MVLIAEVGNRHGHALGGCDGEQQLHDVVVHQGGTGLHDEYDLLPHALDDATADLPNNEPVDVRIARTRVEDGADLRSEFSGGCGR